MIAVFDKDILTNAVNTVSKAVSAKTTMPIFECILIEADSAGITLRASDNELSIETFLSDECKVLEPGHTAVDARIFSDIIKKIEPGDIVIKTDGTIIQINSKSSEFKLQERDADQFPVAPAVLGTSYITVSELALKELIRDTIFSVAVNDSNKMMTGELFEVSEGTLKATSLDGHRISIRKVYIDGEHEYQKAIIPGKALNEISKLLQDSTDSTVDIYLESSMAKFRYGSTIVSTRLIDGEYFRIGSMLSRDYDTRVTINKKDFADYVERAVILTRETDKKPLVMNIKDGMMNLRINTFIASYRSSILINKTGKDLMIGFNPRFILDALKVIDDEEVSLYMTNPKAPCFIRDDEENYIYLILPINFNPAAYDD